MSDIPVDSNLLETAILFSLNKHKSKQLKNGLPYITHPLYVMEKMNSIEEKIVAVLHDVLEDTDATYEELVYLFGENIANSILALTKNKLELYDDYIYRVKNNNLARIVKIEDIKHNLDLTRNKTVVNTICKLNKYLSALEYLSSEE
jgi:(p)ppGpp synthase/HD superfamily hydrolase